MKTAQVQATNRLLGKSFTTAAGIFTSQIDPHSKRRRCAAARPLTARAQQLAIQR